jgi:hypothetical protein
LVVCLVELLFAAGSTLGGWSIMPALVKHSADRYAESAWSCFLQLPSNTSRPADGPHTGPSAAEAGL